MSVNFSITRAVQFNRRTTNHWACLLAETDHTDYNYIRENVIM